MANKTGKKMALFYIKTVKKFNLFLNILNFTFFDTIEITCKAQENICIEMK